ncbi:MAG: M23 family metallopeptidase [Turneriella sp.]|nr:M23 family metallopeptidase [Leptospiraceae bacterium]MCX7633302.1 M23 family metallopeptidase [Turneriella sp.]
MSIKKRIAQKAAQWQKKLRDKGNERVTFLVIPHNDKAIINLQLSNYVIVLAIFTVVFVVLASILATNLQSRIQTEADTLQDRDRAYLRERELYLRKYHEMSLQQELLRKELMRLFRQANLTENAESLFTDPRELQQMAIAMLDSEGEELARMLSYQANRRIKFLNFETTVKMAEGKLEEEGFYFYPEVSHYRKLRLELRQTAQATTILHQLLKERIGVEQALPYFWPLAGGHFTSFFGGRISPFGYGRDFHTGVDLASPIGTPIYAAADGRIVSCGYSGGYGLSLKIAHRYGFETLYGHLSSLHATCGQFVKKGQLIGRVGATGRATGPHLHYEVRILERPINPMPYLTSL